MTIQGEPQPTVGDLSQEGVADRLELIGALALSQRAEGFLQLHDDLQAELERDDALAAAQGNVEASNVAASGGASRA